MTKQDQIIELTGEVVESLPSTTFRVKIKDEKIIFCHLSGKMRRYHIKVMVGDQVKIEMTPYDNQKGRITQRL